MDKTLRRTIKEQLLELGNAVDPIAFDYIECLLKTYETLPVTGAVFTDLVGYPAAFQVAVAVNRELQVDRINNKNPLEQAMAYAKKNKAPAVAIIHERFERDPDILNSFYKFITKKPNYVIPVIIRKYHKVDELQGRGITNERIYFKQYFDLNED